MRDLIRLKAHSKIKTPVIWNAIPVLGVKLKRGIMYFGDFQHRPMFSHINEKLLPKPFE